MTIEIPTTEPTVVYAGTTLAWTKSLTDYPASTYTLTYYLVNTRQRHVVTASASGDTHSVSVAASTTALWTPGKYQWASYAVDGSTKYRVESGVIEVRLDMQAANEVSLRTHARTVLEAIEAVIEGRASKDQESVSVAGRTLTRTPIADLLKLRDVYKAEVAREESAAAGNRNGMRRVYVRFGNA